MSTVSPTPVGSSHFTSLSRRPSNRQMYRQPSRPQVNRQSSAPMMPHNHARTYSLNDSSDEEIPMPVMRFSAITNAILNDPALSVDSTPPTSRSTPEPETNDIYQFKAGNESSQVSPSENSKAQSPHYRRVVRLSTTPGASFRRSKSAAVTVPEVYGAEAARQESPLDLNTPAPAVRTVRLPRSSLGRSTGSSGRSHISGSRHEEAEVAADGHDNAAARSQFAISQGSVLRCGASTIGRTRYGGEDPGLQSSMRLKGVGKLRGAFIRGPARRGRRRISEDEQEPAEENADAEDLGRSSQEINSQESEVYGSQGQDLGSSQEENKGVESFYSSSYQRYSSGSPIGSKEVQSVLLSKSPPPPSLSSALKTSAAQPVAATKPAHPVFRLPPRPELPSSHDQENEAPPTFKKNKQMVLPIRKESAQSKPSHDLTPSIRPPLGPRSQNTPLRPAPPPPPKMTILDTATRTAGAATTSKVDKRKVILKLNGKNYTRLDVIGRGGSSRVYRVMADNSKFLALKRVSLDDADELTVRGFKGEIDLLKRLEGVERVIRLYDYELNEEKGILSVLMEMGELDLNKILEIRIKSEDSKFDPSFVRHYWKEMLECLQAVHEHDVVHSDLKPHNFVLVQGRLKLIDFGIANAIKTDETVNVHRESQIGTPNYMSPESLMDVNAPVADARGRIHNQPKLMKIGKPSDVWSLACILYQMVYGIAPFGHISNQIHRCQAIVKEDYAIEYPPVGVGNVPVPASLIKTMKKCLNRDQTLRPLVSDLLDEHDPFLYPRECPEGAIPMTEELLGRILVNVAAKLKDRTVTETDLLKTWPAGYFERLRKFMAEGESIL